MKTIESKLDNGKVTILGGSLGSTFSIYNSCKAAQASGVGLVGAYVPGCCLIPLESQDVGCRIRSFRSYGSPDAIDEILEHINCFSNCSVLGIGIKEKLDLKYSFFSPILQNSKKVLVIDADLIEVVSQYPKILFKRNNMDVPYILTLNKEEYFKLFRDSFNDARIQEFSSDSNTYILIKGCNSRLFSPKNADPEELFEGNIPKMAVAGMGDLLSGLIGGYVARGFTEREAVIRSFSRRSRSSKKYLKRFPYAESVSPRDILEILRRGEDLAD